MHFSSFFLAAALSCAASGVLASPVTFKFNGTIKSYVAADGGSFISDDSKIGEALSGYYTIDMSNVEKIENNLAQSSRGCETRSNGVCTFGADHGGGTPIITKVSVTTLGKTIAPAGAGGLEWSSILASVYSYYVNYYQLEVDYSRGTRATDYWAFGLSTNAFGASRPNAFETAPNLQYSFDGSASFTLTNYRTSCDAANVYVCTSEAPFTGYSLMGSITTWEIADSREVAEPESLALFGVGILALVGARRRMMK